jgi:hypothetical protein
LVVSNGIEILSNGNIGILFSHLPIFFHPPASLSRFPFSVFLSHATYVPSDVKFSYCAIHHLPAYCIMQTGFVNSLAFAKSGKFLLAGVGQVIV